MVYLHVPFCRSFCTYCDFYSEIACKGRDAAAIDRWTEEVCTEALSRRKEIGQTLDLNTLYIGGGTPSVLPLSVLRRVVECLEEITGAGPRSGRRYEEFTMEVNPEDIVEKGDEYVRGLLDLGVTRFSMGVQSLDDGILRWMNRRHDAADARKAFDILRSARRSNPSPTASLRSAPPSKAGSLPLSRGWRRSCEGFSAGAISVDIITGVPGMTERILAETVDEIISWHPEHISSYQLSVEEGSALAKMIDGGIAAELDEEQCRAQYELVCTRLAAAGYHHYEISNWALPGHEAVHNSAYWTRHPYVGLGPGAHSLIFRKPDGTPAKDGEIQCRSWNAEALENWRNDEDGSGSEILTPEQIREEEIMLLARTAAGPIPEKDWFVADDIIASMI